MEGKKYESEELNSRANNAKCYIVIIQQYETILKRQKRNILKIIDKGA